VGPDITKKPKSNIVNMIIS